MAGTIDRVLSRAITTGTRWVASVSANRVAKNSLYNVLGLVVPILLLVIFTPLLVGRMGIENYGLWTLSVSALGLMGVFEFGLGTAMAKFIAEYSAQHDTEGLSATATVGFTLYLTIGVMLTLPLFFLAPKIARLFPSSTLSLEAIQEAIRLTSLGLVPLLLKTGGLAVPMGLQRFEVPNVVRIAHNALMLTIALIVVSLGGSVEYVILSTVLLMWIIGLISVGIAFRILRPMGARPLFSRGHLRMILGFAVFTGLTGVGGRIFSSMDRVVVGAVLGVSAVTYYVVGIGIANKLLALTDVVSRALMPAASSWYTAGEVHRVWAYLRRATLAVALMSLVLAGVMLLSSGLFMRLWMGNEFAEQALTPFQILILVYAVISINAPAFHIANGIGIPWISATGALAGGAITIALIVVLGRSYGLEGVAWANAGYWVTLIIVVVTAAKLRDSERKQHWSMDVNSY